MTQNKISCVVCGEDSEGGHCGNENVCFDCYKSGDFKDWEEGKRVFRHKSEVLKGEAKLRSDLLAPCEEWEKIAPDTRILKPWQQSYRDAAAEIRYLLDNEKENK